MKQALFSFSYPAFSLLLLGGLLGGCTEIGPDYQTPQLHLGERFQYKSASGKKLSALGEDWWSLLEQKELSKNIEKSLAQNPQIEQAKARLDYARAVLASTGAQLLPSLSLSGSGQQNQSTGNATSMGSFKIPPIKTETYNLPLDASWEPDFWGRLTRAERAAKQEGAASQADLAQVRLLLSLETAKTWLQIQGNLAQQELLQKTLKTRKSKLLSTQEKYELGTTTQIDVARAQLEVHNAEADLKVLLGSFHELTQSLALLRGEAPTPENPTRAQKVKLPSLPVGLPSELLYRRPDVYAAERRLAASSEAIGIAQADFYPRFSLTGNLGLQSDEMKTLLRSSSKIWNYSGSFHLPIPFLQGDSLKYQVKGKEALFATQRATYKEVFLKALGEVEKALSQIQSLEAEITTREQARRSAQQVYNLAQERYTQGLLSFFELVEAEKQLLAQELLCTQLSTKRALATVSLIGALGGGWQKE